MTHFYSFFKLQQPSQSQDHYSPSNILNKQGFCSIQVVHLATSSFKMFLTYDKLLAEKELLN